MSLPFRVVLAGERDGRPGGDNCASAARDHRRALTYQRAQDHAGYAMKMGFSAYMPIIVALGLRLASSPTADISYLAIAAYALLGRAHAIRALALSWLFTMLSSGVAPAAGAASVGRYAVIVAAAVSVVLHGGAFARNLKIKPFTLGTILLGLFIVCHSLVFSPIPEVSILKAVSWTVAMATLISAWLGLSDDAREEVSQQLFWGLVLIMVVSLPLAATSLGYLRNSSGLQGILNHPQSFGPTMALLGSWAAARLFGEARPPWWLVGIVAACLICVLLSEARTAGLALIAGVTLSILFAPSFARRPRLHLAPGLRSARVWSVIGVVFVTGLVMAPTLADTFQHYITKSGRADADGLFDAFDRSRGRLIETMQDNIAERPLTGIGFGIASQPELMVVERDSILGLPTGASIEKGVVPLAVLEEIGIVGAALVAFWVLALLRRSARGGIAQFSVCLTALLLNLGEATLFSPGGLGLLPMILFGWASAMGPSGRRYRDG